MKSKIVLASLRRQVSLQRFRREDTLPGDFPSRKVLRGHCTGDARHQGQGITACTTAIHITF